MSGELKAGRELDALIAERVMGARWEHPEGWANLKFPRGAMHLATRDEGGLVRVNPACPHYLGSLADAWRIVEHINRNRDAVDWAGWTCAWGNADRLEMKSSSQLAEWICLAALSSSPPILKGDQK